MNLAAEDGVLFANSNAGRWNRSFISILPQPFNEEHLLSAFEKFGSITAFSLHPELHLLSMKICLGRGVVISEGTARHAESRELLREIGADNLDGINLYVNCYE